MQNCPNRYREVAAANAKALIDELNLTSDEYAEMVAKQSKPFLLCKRSLRRRTKRYACCV